MHPETKDEISAVKSAALNLLIVDDEVATRNLCNDVALDAGLHVHTSETTEQALDILDQHPIDIVVTDFGMPNMYGVKLRTALRKLRPRLEVLFITGNPETCEMLASKNFICLQEPFDLTELASTIRLTLLSTRKEREK